MACASWSLESIASVLSLHRSLGPFVLALHLVSLLACEVATWENRVVLDRRGGVVTVAEPHKLMLLDSADTLKRHDEHFTTVHHSAKRQLGVYDRSCF